MKQLAKKTVIDYSYTDAHQANLHEQKMKHDGWNVDSKQHIFVKHFRRYSKPDTDGMNLPLKR